jgi:transposase
MMGQCACSEALFYYFRLEDQVPENHLLRLIDKHISFEFVRQQLKDSYSEAGRPSVDPELLLRILLIGYRYDVTSERKLVNAALESIQTINVTRSVQGHSCRGRAPSSPPLKLCSTISLPFGSSLKPFLG